MDKITIGNQAFEGERLIPGNFSASSSLPCDKLVTDTLRVVVDGASKFGTRFVPKGSSGMLTAKGKEFFAAPYIKSLTDDPTVYPYGTPVYYHRGEKLVAKLYKMKAKQKGEFLYEMSCISAVGLLDNTTHWGGIYQGAKIESVLNEIIGGLFQYTLDPEYKSIMVYGWLPKSSRRDNLRQLLFAFGLVTLRDPNGNPLFTAITEDIRAPIPDSRIANAGSVDNGTPATGVEVSEHVFTAYDTDQQAVLFEGDVLAEPLVTPNGASVSGTIVEFRGPMHSLSITNGSILESGVNYAVLGFAFGSKLVGKEYTHTIRIVSNKPTGRASDSSENIKKITDATLVSMTNSENVAERMMSYYGNAKVVQSDIIVDTERTGNAVTFTDPFNVIRDGFLQAMDIRMSKVLKARATLVFGYVPPKIGGDYTRFTVLTGTGTWTVPPGVSRIRVVPIGAGWGGGAGTNGVGGLGVSLSVSASAAIKGGTWTMPPGSPGIGGNAGSAGLGGKIFQATESVTPGQTFSFRAGVAGVAGASNGAPGQAGAESVFGPFSSANGSISANGYVNILSGVIYGRPGKAGAKGGNGGSGGNSSSASADNGSTGESVEQYQGGIGSSGWYDKASLSVRTESYGGSGGGGSARGKKGVNADAYDKGAGKGADATTLRPALNYGDGGNGGSGGGGGGSGGGMYINLGQGVAKDGFSFYHPGATGGLFSPGQNGADGCVIVYY